MKKVALSFTLFASALFAASPPKEIYFAMQDYPPFYYQQGSNPFSGAAVEMTEQACKQLNFHCTFGMTTFARLLVDLKNGQVNAAPFVVNDPQNNPERLEYMAFSDPIYQSSYAYLGLKNHVKSVQKLEDLEGWSIGLIRNSYGEKLAQKAIDNKINLLTQAESNVPALLKKLAAKRYGDPEKSAILVSEDVAQYYAKQMDTELTTIFVPEVKLYSIGFSKKTVSQETINAFNDAIQEMKKDHTLEGLAKKYNVTLAP